MIDCEKLENLRLFWRKLWNIIFIFVIDYSFFFWILNDWLRKTFHFRYWLFVFFFEYWTIDCEKFFISVIDYSRHFFECWTIDCEKFRKLQNRFWVEWLNREFWFYCFENEFRSKRLKNEFDFDEFNNSYDKLFLFCWSFRLFR